MEQQIHDIAQQMNDVLWGNEEFIVAATALAEERSGTNKEDDEQRFDQEYMQVCIEVALALVLQCVRNRDQESATS